MHHCQVLLLWTDERLSSRNSLLCFLWSRPPTISWGPWSCSGDYPEAWMRNGELIPDETPRLENGKDIPRWNKMCMMKAHRFLFLKKICHINGKKKKKLKPTVAAAPSRGSWLSIPVQLMIKTLLEMMFSPQQLHSRTRLSWSRNKRRKLVIHKHLASFPVKTSELTVASALRWSRCDTFYNVFRGEQTLDGSTMVQRPAIAGALASMPAVIVHIYTFLLTFLTWPDVSKSKQSEQNSFIQLNLSIFLPNTLFLSFSWATWPWKEQLMLFLHRLNTNCIFWLQFKLRQINNIIVVTWVGLWHLYN